MVPTKKGCAKHRRTILDFSSMIVLRHLVAMGNMENAQNVQIDPI